MSALDTSPRTDIADAPAVSRGTLRGLLAGMMFLEYAVWGAWMPVLSATLTARGISGTAIGNVYGALWLACILSPFLGGQLADRLMSAQKYLGVSHLLAAGAAYMVAQQTDPTMLAVWMLVWALLFAPSLGITNAIAFHHIDRAGLPEANKEREFSWIRTAGTIGWIVAAFLLLGFVSAAKLDPTGKTGAIPEMLLAAALGIVMGVFSFFLPNTPPAKENKDPLAFREAFGLFKSVPGFAIFMAVSFIAATEFQFFYLLSGPFLEEGKYISHEMVAPVKAISQVAEIVALSMLLPLWLPSKGMKWCLLLGSFAWPLRYFIFAVGQPGWLVIASLALHGFGYAFVLVVQQLYVDRVAPKDIRASAQSLLNFITLGIGNLLGTLFSGWVKDFFTKQDPTTQAAVTSWGPVFILPGILTLLCAFAYMFTFRNPEVGHSRD